MTRNLLVLASLLALTGCTHTVKYKLTEQDRWTGPKINKTVAVETLTDKTTPETRKEIDIDKDTWRTNYRSRYANSNLTAGVSAMIAKHLAHFTHPDNALKEAVTEMIRRVGSAQATNQVSAGR